MKRAGAWALAAGLVVVTAPRGATAQLPEAEAAFRRGDTKAARGLYEQVLAVDSLNVRALYRLAVLDSWDGDLERSLARFARLRALEPLDVDLMVAHARVLGWAERHTAALALYDSALARDPDRADALAGRARTVAWSGDLERAERLWRDALERHPDDAETLVGLAQTLWWRGRAELAEAYLVRARALAPDDATAQELERQLRAVLRPDARTTVDYSDDSDDNRLINLEARTSGALGDPDRRGTLTVGWKHATDPVRPAATSLGGHVSLVMPLVARASLRAGVGLRRLAPDTGAATVPLTAVLGVTFRPSRVSGIALTYSREPFDETALLIDSGFVLDGAELAADVWGTRGSASLSAGAGWMSDGNRRWHALAAGLLAVLPGLEAGPFARVLAWSEPGSGYFSPDQYTVLELRAVYALQRERWTLRLDGGLGGQQIGAGVDWQDEWHAGLTVTRGWSALNEVALVGSFTNAAATSATGAFRYGLVGLRVRLGL